MEVGDIINFYLFSEEVQGEVLSIDKKEKTIKAMHEGYKYTIQTFSKLPKRNQIYHPGIC